MNCCYPGCDQEATSTWALVPLCIHHHKSIEEETDKYYNADRSNRIPYGERVTYLKIVEQVPFGSKV